MKSFSNVAMQPSHPNWEKAVSRENELYERTDDIRSPFLRDYTRVLHSLAYRRLKHKTQVFYGAAGSDHICTRIEHVSHVESVSNSIARTLGLNEELTRAIAMAHDLGHAPFGHRGESILSKLSMEYLGKLFWHEANGVYFADNIELLDDPQNKKRNLDLTYAVRDGIISHCGEVDQNKIRPRDISIPLTEIKPGGALQAATWEGCVVKFADKIAYLGRDIEDAKRLRYFSDAQLQTLRELAGKCNRDAVNTTVITHSMIIDICEHSSIEEGLTLSPLMEEVLAEIKKFNYENIYKNKRLRYFDAYAELIINSLFRELSTYYEGPETFRKLEEDDFHRRKFIEEFARYLADYCDLPEDAPEWAKEDTEHLLNKKVYGSLETKEHYLQAVVDYIAGMTDNYAVDAFGQLLMC
jgi:dGTPase